MNMSKHKVMYHTPRYTCKQKTTRKYRRICDLRQLLLNKANKIKETMRIKRLVCGTFQKISNIQWKMLKTK